MTKYKMIFSDLDGTLLGSDNQLSAQNAQAIKALNERGVLFVPSTGRTISEITPALTDNPSVRYVSYSNGVGVWDKQTGEKFGFMLTQQVANAIIDVLQDYDVHWAVRSDGICYVDAAQLDENSFVYYNLTQPHVDCVNTFGVPKNDYVNFVRSLKEVEVIALFFHSADQLAECNQRILAMGGLSSAGTNAYNLEIFNSDAGKGHTLVALAQRLGIPVEQTIAMGDSENDLSMIKAAGLGLATANAFDFVKEKADAVICSNDEHVAKYVLEHFFD